MLVGNKLDLKYLRGVITEEVLNFVEREGLFFVEILVLEFINVEKVF